MASLVSSSPSSDLSLSVGYFPHGDELSYEDSGSDTSLPYLVPPIQSKWKIENLGRQRGRRQKGEDSPTLYGSSLERKDTVAMTSCNLYRDAGWGDRKLPGKKQLKLRQLNSLVQKLQTFLENQNSDESTDEASQAPGSPAPDLAEQQVTEHQVPGQGEGIQFMEEDQTLQGHDLVGVSKGHPRCQGSVGTGGRQGKALWFERVAQTWSCKGRGGHNDPERENSWETKDTLMVTSRTHTEGLCWLMGQGWYNPVGASNPCSFSCSGGAWKQMAPPYGQGTQRMRPLPGTYIAIPASTSGQPSAGFDSMSFLPSGAGATQTGVPQRGLFAVACGSSHRCPSSWAPLEPRALGSPVHPVSDCLPINLGRGICGPVWFFLHDPFYWLPLTPHLLQLWHSHKAR